MRRMPPQHIEENLAGLLDIVPDLTEDLLSAVDQPLKVRHAPSAGTMAHPDMRACAGSRGSRVGRVFQVQKCRVTGKDYLLCDYNRDGDSYRYEAVGALDAWTVVVARTC